MKSDLDALMQDRKLDAILVFGDAEYNPPMYYFVGGGHVSSALLIKKVGKEPVLFYNDMERDEAARSGLKIVSFSEYPVADFLEQADGDIQTATALSFQKILSEFGLSGGRIAVYGKIEFSQLFGVLMKLTGLMPELELVGEPGLDSTLLRAMETKDAVEVARIRRMGAVTTTVVKMVQDYLTSREVREDEVLLKEDGNPLTIGDVKNKIALWLAERGAVDVEGLIFAIGRDAGVPHSTGNPADLITLGKTIIFDIFPAEQGGGYFYDFTRTWSLGYAAPEAQALYDQVQEIYNKVVENLDLNASFVDYQRMTSEYFESKGHKSPLNTKAPLDGYVHTLGHGVGLNVHERPWSGFTSPGDNILKPGVVITLEPGLYYPDKEMGARIEDTYWVRPDGKTELLAEYPYDFVLPMKKWKKS
ncbi:MAG: aminopeptidase P family protein [Chloroflexi bacterium]|nr:MAG: aminopeptidase P family protein [Chloroflexota bacterium]RPI95837.1 MAG: aminopeptidase P family protein [Chloroflexota bacterium]